MCYKNLREARQDNMSIAIKVIFSKNLIRWKMCFLYALAAIILLFFLSKFGQIGFKEMNDFKVYYFAGKTWIESGNPYDHEELVRRSGENNLPSFKYPKALLSIFAIFSKMPPELSSKVYLGIKIFALILLLFIWSELYITDVKKGVLCAITILFGFQATIYLDFVSGNISIFEQVFLWVGIWLLSKRRSGAACFFITLSAIPKSLFVFFLAMPILYMPLWPTLFYACSAFVLLASCFIPSGFESFRSAIPILLTQHNERGDINPCSLAIFRDLTNQFGLTDKVALWIYLLFCLLIIGILTLLVARKTIMGCFNIIVSLMIFSYVLIAPVVKDYTYIIALMPAIFVIETIVRRQIIKLALYSLLWTNIFVYQSFIVVLVLFTILVLRVYRRGNPINRQHSHG